MTAPSLKEKLEALTNKYKKHAYDGEVEQTVDALEALVAKEVAKAHAEDAERLRLGYEVASERLGSKKASPKSGLLRDRGEV